jgi:hypothetical protein
MAIAAVLAGILEYGSIGRQTAQGTVWLKRGLLQAPFQFRGVAKALSKETEVYGEENANHAKN